jgi:hypothetical protein
MRSLNFHSGRDISSAEGTSSRSDSPTSSVGDGPKPVQLRLGGFHRDDRGQMTLLAAMMSFLVAIFVAVGVYTNIAIHRRITVQNAVDSAAEAAALWQARGCNLVQGLNNLHYDINVIAGVGESVAAAGCVASLLPFPAAKPIGCALCALGPGIDAGQQLASSFILQTQRVVVDITPVLAFLAANASAHGSGAEPFLAAVPAAVSEWLHAVGDELSGQIDSSFGLRAMGNFLGAISSHPIARSIPIYAAPMDPKFFDFGVYRKQGKKFPWTYPSQMGDYVIEPIGQTWCRSFYRPVERLAVGAGWNGKWGWKDSYYFGNPGYMTWLAGMEPAMDRLGMGNLIWMTGGRRDLNTIDTMYTGPVRGGSLTVPAVLGIASSQVEGTPVVDKGDTDAKGKLIKVHVPTSASGRSFIEGDAFGILH